MAATEGERLQISLEARMTKYERDLQRAGRTTDRSFGAIERRAATAGKRMENSMRSSVAGLNGILAGLGVGIGLNEIRNLAEAWTDISSRVNIAAGSQEKGAAVMDRVAQIARRTYSDLGQTAEAYIQNSTAMKELGYSTQTQLDYTEALNNALVVSGAKGQRAESVMNALSKAMALGKLSGENLNTVLSTGGRVTQALATGLSVGVNELRKLGSEGKLTGDKVVKALTGQLQQLREEAESMPATISDAFVLLKNSMTQYVGQLNEANGATGIFVDGIIFAADHVGSVAAAAAAAGAAILSGYVPALGRAAMAQAAMVATNPFLALAAVIGAATFALSAFGDQVTPISGDLANLQDYAGAAWTGIKEGVLSASAAIGDRLIAAINLISSAIGGAEISFGDLADFIKQVVNQIIGEYVLLYETVVNVFTKLPAAIGEAVINAMNSMIAGVESGLNAVVNAVNSTIGAINGVGGAIGVSLGTIGNVTLGRIENAYTGAGEAAGTAYGEALKKAAQDHVGNALGAWRTAANENAATRIANEGQDSGGAIDSVDNPTVPVSAGSGGGGGRGGRGGGKRENAFERQVGQIQQRIAALHAETDARRGLSGSLEEQEAALERARMKHELLTAAQNAGLAITPELEARIDALADSYSAASQEAQALATSQEEAARTAQEMANFAGSLASGFVNDLRQGKSAAEAFGNSLNKIIDKLLDMAIQMLVVKPLMSAFGGGGLFGMLGLSGGGPVDAWGGLRLAGGGGVRGPGTSTSDSIPAMLSNGEYVVNARQTQKHRALLEAINSGQVSRFAAGGPVGAGNGGGGWMADRGGAPTVSINAPVTVNASGGTPEQNDDLARKTAKQMEIAMRGVVQQEMQTALRPGGIMSGRGR